MRSSCVVGRFSRAAARAVLAGACFALLLTGGCASSPPPKAPPATASADTPDVPVSALVGNWLFEIKMGSRTLEGSLHFTNGNGVLAGTWTSAEGNEYELKEIRIKGNVVSWTGDGPGGTQAASGTIDGTSMKGTMKRAARKRNGDGSSGSSGSSGGSDDAPPPSDADTTPRGGGRRGGGRGSGRRGGSTSTVTWSAFKSVGESGEASAPRPSPTPAAPR